MASILHAHHVLGPRARTPYGIGVEDVPIAKNGLVPRNNFGNVDLYKESMLPIGCVWIKDILEPAIFSRTCKKLDIDCVKAVTGFDGKKGYPVTEGYVLCKEFEVI